MFIITKEVGNYGVVLYVPLSGYDVLHHPLSHLHREDKQSKVLDINPH
jgi:hypothetical protein